MHSQWSPIQNDGFPPSAGRASKRRTNNGLSFPMNSGSDYPIRILIALVLLLFLPACRSKDEDHAWEQVQATGVVRVGMDAAYPPFEDVTDAGDIVGFDVDLAREIGRRLGVEVAFVNIPYDGLYDALVTGQVELLISALVAGWENEAKANFSVPYFNSGEHLVVLADSDLSAMDEMGGHILAVEYGSGGDVEARQWERRLANLTVNRYPDPGTALTAVLEGEADAALVDGISARLGAGQHPELTAKAQESDQLFAVAVGEDSLELLTQVNGALSAMLEDGTVGELINRWFGPQQ